MAEFIRNVKIVIDVMVDTNKRTVRSKGEFESSEEAVEWLNSEQNNLLDQMSEGSDKDPFGGADPASSIGEVVFAQTVDTGLEIELHLNENGKKLMTWMNRDDNAN